MIATATFGTDTLRQCAHSTQSKCVYHAGAALGDCAMLVGDMLLVAGAHKGEV
jgi:hypothetical protein